MACLLIGSITRANTFASSLTFIFLEVCTAIRDSAAVWWWQLRCRLPFGWLGGVILNWR
jgi:hypothetical protein